MEVYGRFGTTYAHRVDLKICRPVPVSVGRGEYRYGFSNGQRAPHVFVALFYRRLVLWTLGWLALCCSIIYLSSFFGTGRFGFDFINAVVVSLLCCC